MRAELANLNHYAVPFLSRTAVNLSSYDSIVLPNQIWQFQDGALSLTILTQSTVFFYWIGWYFTKGSKSEGGWAWRSHQHI